MQWYYAVGNEQRGPVSTENLARLVHNGEIGENSLVWREGMANWAPLNQVPEWPLPPVVPPGPPPFPGAAPVAEPEPAVPPEDIVLSPDELWARIQSRGLRFRAFDSLEEIWQAYKANFGVSFAVALVGALLMGVAGSVPIIGMAAAFVVSPQIAAGVQWFFLQAVRGNELRFEMLFDGFKRAFGNLALVQLLVIALALPVIFVVVGIFVTGGLLGEAQSDGPAIGAVLLGVLVGLVGGLVLLRLKFAHLLAIDRGYAAWDCIKLSWRLSGPSYWALLGIAVLTMFLALMGLVALLIGILFVMPLLQGVYAAAYRQVVDAGLAEEA